MNANEIDEINAYNNGDGSFTVEMRMSDATRIVTFTMPHACIDIAAINGGLFSPVRFELTITGEMSS